jgi:hypothetical protein
MFTQAASFEPTNCRAILLASVTLPAVTRITTLSVMNPPREAGKRSWFGAELISHLGSAGQLTALSPNFSFSLRMAMRGQRMIVRK